ncbi:MAG TPA: AMP-binding protein [Actinomycetales bacterium]|nr:AMP-binding protein [Actinomycetales bacterium]
MADTTSVTSGRGDGGHGEDGYGRLRAARDLLLELREDYDAARERFTWPELDEFNWGLDWFDRVADDAETGRRTALRVVDADGTDTSVTYAEMAERSTQVGAWLQSVGVGGGDRVLLMLGNQVELWEVLLACIKIRAVLIPATTLLAPADLTDRIERGNVRHVIARSEDTGKFADVEGSWTRIAVGSPVEGWLDYADSATHAGELAIESPTHADDTLLLYFTSGTTARPKLVEHTQASYPVGHLSTMYWIGLRPGDVHLNISSPGWAKHAWSNVFAPWLAEATVLVVNQPRFDAESLLQTMERCEVNAFCAPPTVWRMLVQADLGRYRGRIPLRSVVGAGEPLNPEVIEQVEKAWGVVIRDGYGQTETTLQIGNTPGQRLLAGSMGRPVPGYDVVLVDPLTGQERTGSGEEGEICLRLDGRYGRPLGLMVGYHGDGGRTDEAMKGGVYHTGDVASMDSDGYITYVGRADDVFKASDYRISPFELESVLIEHEAVAEAAVVPSPDPTRLSVPKAYVVLAAGYEPNAETAESILRYCREHLAPYKRIRRIEFAELPKTISGKIRRVELRGREGELHGIGHDSARRVSEYEFWEDDFPTLKQNG